MLKIYAVVQAPQQMHSKSEFIYSTIKTKTIQNNGFNFKPKTKTT